MGSGPTEGRRYGGFYEGRPIRSLTVQMGEPCDSRSDGRRVVMGECDVRDSSGKHDDKQKPLKPSMKSKDPPRGEKRKWKEEESKPREKQSRAGDELEKDAVRGSTEKSKSDYPSSKKRSKSKGGDKGDSSGDRHKKGDKSSRDKGSIPGSSRGKDETDSQKESNRSESGEKRKGDTSSKQRRMNIPSLEGDKREEQEKERLLETPETAPVCDDIMHGADHYQSRGRKPE